MSLIIEQSFSLQLKVLNTFGLYPSKTRPVLQKVKGYVLYFILLVLVTILVFINIIFKDHTDSIQMNLMLSLFVSAALSCVKLLPFLKYPERIAKHVNYFGHPRFAAKSNEEKRIVNECVQVCRRNSLIYFNLLLCGTFAWICPYLLADEYLLPMDVWLPYDITARPMAYYSTFAFLIAACAYASFSGTMLDPLLGGLVYHARAQLKILVYNLQHLNKNVNNKAYKNQNYSTVTLECVSGHLRRCVDHHNHILNFVKEFENCFSLSVFSQFITGIFGTCFICIALIFAPANSFEAFTSVICFSVFLVQMLFYCYYGTLLFEENERFIDGVCMGPWYDYDVKIRKILIIMMERSKRPMIVVAGKLVGLTLGTFTALVKTSYSMIAVMKKFQ